jgi:hypothetical protein
MKCPVVDLLLLLLLLLLTAIELSLDGSTGKTSKKTYINETIQKTQYKQHKTRYIQVHKLPKQTNIIKQVKTTT